MRHRAKLVGIALIAMAAGCKNSSSGLSIASACADVAVARCSQGSGCSLPDYETGTGFNTLATYGSTAACIERQTLSCTNGLNAPHTGNSPNQVELCVAALAGESCAQFFDNDPPGACTPTGLLANGASCTFSGQCMSGYCNGTKTSICGTCGAGPAVGADCTNSSCLYGERCVLASTVCQ